MFEGEKRYVKNKDSQIIKFTVKKVLGYAHDLNRPYKVEEGLITEKEIVETENGNFILRWGTRPENTDRSKLENTYEVYQDEVSLSQNLDPDCPLERSLIEHLEKANIQNIAIPV